MLEMPTRQGTEVVAHPDDAFVVGPASVLDGRTRRLAGLAYADVRRGLARVSPLDALRHRGRPRAGAPRGDRPTPVRLEISSDLPASVGVASSAALEVATARALGAADIDPLRLAALCQEAENHVVGAPVRDHGPGRGGARDTRGGAADPVPAGVGGRPRRRAAGLEIVGWPTGTPHDVGGPPYARARAAAFMGKRMVEDAAGRHVVLGERAAHAPPSTSFPDGDRRRHLPQSLGRRPTTTSRSSDPTRRIRSGRPRRSASRSTCGAVAALAALADGEPVAARAADGGQSGRLRRHGPGSSGRDARSWRRRWPDPACTAPARAEAAVAAPSSSCASAARSTTSRRLIR